MQQRKLYHDAFAKHAVTQYREIQEQEANVLLKSMMDKPKDYDRHVQRYVCQVLDDRSTF